MDTINRIVSGVYANPGAYIEQIMEEVYKNGDILLIKVDGPRLKNRFTIVMIAKNEEFPTIRLDHDSLPTAVTSVLKKYIQHKN